jgi:tetratricopeptide (TPR) repeat protein
VQRGERIADRFEIERVAGAGGMGTVYLARDLATGDEVAVKVLRGAGGRGVERFEREAMVLAALDHPRIVRYVAHGVPEAGVMFLAMEWLEGEDLEERLARGPLSPEETVALARHATEALGAAHARGVVHRDIKPSNLFLVGGELEALKLLDFGVARLRGGQGATGTGITVGTPGYMAPEQVRGAREIDARADMFSLGCVAFECLTGQPAFHGKDIGAILAKVLVEEAPRLSDVVSSVPPALDALVARLLDKDPAARPASAEELNDELAALASGALGPIGPRGTARATLTEGERRLASIVLVGAPCRFDAETIDSSDELVPPRATAPTIDQVFLGLAALRAAAAPFRARVEPLLDGSVVVLLPDEDAATDRAARAADCALALRAVEPSAPMALATGRTEVIGRLPIGLAIDRAASLLRGAADAAGAGIPIDDVTAGLLDVRYELARVGAGLVLRGRRENEGIRTLLGRPTPCVGRETELHQLEDAFAECVDEPVARAAVVIGPAGAGKSRVRHELLERLEGQAQVWSAGGEPLRAGSPFGLVAELLEGTAGMLKGEPLEVRRRKLAARAGRHLAPTDAARVADFLGEIAGAPQPDVDRVKLRAARGDPMLMGDQIRSAFHDLVVAEAKAGPLFIVLEDLHWGDLPSVKLVDAALRCADELPLFVLALARPEVDEIFPDLWAARGATRLRLGGLTRKAGERLVRHVLGDALDREGVDRLLDQAAGNAFYLEELLRAVARGAAGTMPETVLAMVEARLSSLAPDARRLLRAASVFGPVFWASGVSALVGHDAATGHLDALVEREVVVRRGRGKFAGESEYAFRHAPVREAAYAMLTEVDREVGHREAARWLEAAGETDAMALAEHLERGCEPLRAAAYYRRAAEQALDGNDLEAAIARARRGIACGAEGEARGALRLVEAQALKWRGVSVGDAEPCILEAMELLARGSEPWCLAAGELANAITLHGDADRLEALAEDLAAALPREGATGALVVAAARTAVLLLVLRRYALGEALADACERAAATLQPTPPIVMAYLFNLRAQRALAGGDPGSFLTLTTEVARWFDEAGAVRSASNRRVSVGYAYLELGGFAEAERVLAEARATADRMGLSAVVANASQNLGWAMYRLGRLDDARRRIEPTVEAFRTQGSRRMEGGSRDYLASNFAKAGDHARAEAEARAAVRLLETAPPLRAGALATLASVLLSAGRDDEALAAAREAAAMLDELGSIEEGEALVRLVLAESLDRAGCRDEARAAIAVARDRLLAKAARIGDARWRESFLGNVEEHARTLALAQEWLA